MEVFQPGSLEKLLRPSSGTHSEASSPDEAPDATWGPWRGSELPAGGRSWGTLRMDGQRQSSFLRQKASMLRTERQLLCPGWVEPGQAVRSTAMEAKSGPGSVTFL